MSWNYRVVQVDYPNGEQEFEVCEVYYTDSGDVNGRSGATCVSGATLDDLRWQLEKMTEALDKPVVMPEASDAR